MNCTVDGCDRPSARGGKCWGHVKRRQRNKELAPELHPRKRSSWETLCDAVLDLLDLKTSDTEGWRKAWNRVRMAAVRYAVHGVHKGTKTSLRG